MSRMFVVGPLRDADEVAAATSHVGVDPEQWNREVPREEHPAGSLFEIMALASFATSSEGLEDIEAALTQSRYRHLPFYPNAIWLPVDFTEPLFPLLDVKIEPYQLGSCQRVLRDLQRLRALDGWDESSQASHFAAALEHALQRSIELSTPVRL